MPLLLWFSALQALDVVSTWAVLGVGGVEGNPIMRGVVRVPWLFVGLKVAAVAVVWFAVRQRSRLVDASVWVACLVYSGVVLTNFIVFLTLV